MDSTFHTYPNQKIVKICKADFGTTRAPYLKLNIRYLNFALKKLSPAAFAIYLNAMVNTEGFEYDISPAVLAKITGYRPSTLKEARRELEATGYIENGCFYPVPRDARLVLEGLEKEKQEIDEVFEKLR